MKTKINDMYIDLSRVFAIGPLTAGSGMGDGRSNQFGCMVYFGPSIREALWIAVTQDTYDQYKIAGDENDAVKSKAKEAYNKFVSDWNQA